MAAVRHERIVNETSISCAVNPFESTAVLISSPDLSKASGKDDIMVFGTRKSIYTIVKYAVTPENSSV